MMKKRNTLNNISMENYRRNPLYQTLVTDLCLEGIIQKADAERMLGYEIPAYLKGPSGASLEGSAPAKKKGKESRATGEADTTQYAGDEEEGLFKGR